jgi:RNA-binding protein
MAAFWSSCKLPEAVTAGVMLAPNRRFEIAARTLPPMDLHHGKATTSTMQPITTKERRWLKQQAHHLKPVVMLGQHGLTEAVMREIELALDHHELIKTKIAAGDREEREQIIAAITQETHAELVQRVGNTASFYRHNPDKAEPLALPAS